MDDGLVLGYPELHHTLYKVVLILVVVEDGLVLKGTWFRDVFTSES